MSEIAMSYFAALSTTSPSPHTEKLRLNQRPPLLFLTKAPSGSQANLRVAAEANLYVAS
jgi:hypothetical protein